MIGNDTSKTYDIILYKDKQNILTRAKLSENLLYTLNENNFSTFYDDSNQNWLVRFDSAADFQEFTVEIEQRGAKIIDSSKENSKFNDTEQASVKQNSHSPEVLQQNTKEKECDMNSDSSGTQMKADILSRMAKMGQPILPVLALKSSADISDSESDTNKIVKKPIRKPRRNILSSENTSKQIETVKVTLDDNRVLPQQPTVSYQSIPGPIVSVQSPVQYQNYPGQVVIAQPTLSPSYDPVNVFLSETRTQNTEIRMTLAELSNKLDVVLGKVRKDDVQSNEEKVLQTKVKALELQAMNLTKDLQVSLKTNEELGKKLQNCDSGDTVVEKTNEMKILELESRLKEKELYIKKLEARNIDDETFVRNVMSVAEKHSYDINDFVELCTRKPAYRPLIYLISNLKQKFQESEKNRRAAMRAEINRTSPNLAVFDGKVQGVMNDLYHNIVKNYNTTDATISHDFITKTLPQNMKFATNFILQEVHNNFHCSNVAPQSSYKLTEESTVLEFGD